MPKPSVNIYKMDFWTTDYEAVNEYIRSQVPRGEKYTTTATEVFIFLKSFHNLQKPLLSVSANMFRKQLWYKYRT